MSALLRYARIWFAQIRYSVVREMMFKANFILWVLVDLAWFAVQLAFIQFIYLQVSNVAGWTKWEMILLVATKMVVQQSFQMTLMINLTKLPELVRTGKLDFYLAQPAPVQFLISTRQFDLQSVVNTLMALVVCGVAFVHLDLRFSLAGLILFPGLIVLGILIHYSLMLMVMSLSFWMTRASGFVNAYYSLFQISGLPREAFFGPVRFMLSWVIPLLLVANVPARTLLHGLDLGDLAQIALATSLLFTVSTLVFQAGLRRYGSASS